MNKKNVAVFAITLLLLSSFSLLVTGDEQTHMIIRIDISNGHVPLPQSAELICEHQNDYIEILIPESALAEIDAPYTILTYDLESELAITAESYMTLAQIESELSALHEAYPDITELTSIATTYEGRDVLCLEITDNPGIDEDEPGVLYCGLHHAREWPTVNICFSIAHELLDNYDEGTTDLINGNRIWILPCINPDGYYYDHDQHDGSRWWRKNRHYFPDSNSYGVDLNRNYAGSSDGNPDGAWGSIGSNSVSHDLTNDVYCGPGPASENEITALQNFIIDNEIHAGISYHTSGELVMWPWGYSSSHAPDYDALVDIGRGIASVITRQSGTGTYTPQQSAGLYTTSGDTTDWAYGYGHYVLGRPIFLYTLETCSSFHPDDAYLEQICDENVDGAIYLLEQAQSIKDTTIPRVIPPVITPQTTVEAPYTVEWTEADPAADVDYWQLDGLSGSEILIDTAEDSNEHWVLDGFNRNTEKPCNDDYSYKAVNGNKLISSMTSSQPIYIEPSMELSFNIWYDTETNYDYAIVEVSTNGRHYDVLDTYNGNSDGWMHKTYSLNPYIGQSILIRFRYTTDSNTVGEGVYIDDITPIVTYNRIETHASNIETTNYTIYETPTGDIYYQVRGHNAEHGWGDYSTLMKISDSAENHAPDTPATPNGPTESSPGIDCDYLSTTLDVDGDDIHYRFDFGDGTITAWSEAITSGTDTTCRYNWSTDGTYAVRVQAKDTQGAESSWSEPLIVTIGEGGSQLEITSITGGFFITATLSNEGTGDTGHIDCSVCVNGTIILGGNPTEFSSEGLLAGEQLIVEKGPLLGFGPLVITVEATTADGSLSEVAEGRLLLFYTLL